MNVREPPEGSAKKGQRRAWTPAPLFHACIGMLLSTSSLLSRDSSVPIRRGLLPVSLLGSCPQLQISSSPSPCFMRDGEGTGPWLEGVVNKEQRRRQGLIRRLAVAGQGWLLTSPPVFSPRISSCPAERAGTILLPARAGSGVKLHPRQLQKLPSKSSGQASHLPLQVAYHQNPHLSLGHMAVVCSLPQHRVSSAPLKCCPVK